MARRITKTRQPSKRREHVVLPLLDGTRTWADVLRLTDDETEIPCTGTGCSECGHTGCDRDYGN